MTAGSAPMKGGVALATLALRQRLRELRAAFDTIVISAPPVSEGSTAGGFAAAVDGVVLIATARLGALIDNNLNRSTIDTLEDEGGTEVTRGAQHVPAAWRLQAVPDLADNRRAAW